MKKRITLIITIAAMAFSVACGSDNKSTGSSDSSGISVGKVTEGAEAGQSSSTEPGSIEPGSTEPGSTDPGNTDPGNTDPVDDPGKAKYTYFVYAPEGYTISADGAAIGSEMLTGNTEKGLDNDNVAKYVTVPELKQYKYEVNDEVSEIEITSPAGLAHKYVPDVNNIVKMSYDDYAAEVPEDVKTLALSSAKIWQRFLLNELNGLAHGLSDVQAIVAKDSFYYDMAKVYANGVDITFISNHYNASPEYTNESVSDYVKYSDDCYSVYVKMTKNVVLTRTGEALSDDFNAILYFVNVDDLGTGTKHWVIAGMKSKTEPAESDEFGPNGIRTVEVAGQSFFGKMMIVKDPSKVVVGSTYPWTAYGKTVGEIVNNYGAIAGINGGMYDSAGNKGGTPIGVVVEKGVITYNAPNSIVGMYMIGMDNNNKLVVKDLAGMTPAAFKNYVEENGIRDAVAFEQDDIDPNNHFVTVVENGQGVQRNTTPNPRTVIGQREDGTILMLVTDGRGAGANLGATAQEVADIMVEFGAVTAANLDGGSSSAMYAGGQYEMTSITYYYRKSSWNMPTVFLVMP